MNIKSGNLPIYAICTTEEAQEYGQLTTKGRWSLLPSETWWRNHAPILQEYGYTLRPRYSPDWFPSWIGTFRVPDFCEDSIIPNNDHVIDATRDGRVVSIKIVPRDSKEAEIASFLSSQDLIRLPSNHCVPVLDVLSDPKLDSKLFLVTPYLRPFDVPAFGAVGEVVDFIEQTLEGLCFMHSHGVAHRDCAAANIMMDGSPLYPQGHHPVRLDYTPDGVYDAPYLSRMDNPVKYYFIDFGISMQFRQGDPPYVLGTKGRDKSAPELSNTVPYNPFLLDVYILGHLYQQEFLAKYHGLDFLSPLVSEMLQVIPEDRPAAQDALLMFRGLTSERNNVSLRWRLRPYSESISERVVYDAVAAARESMYHLKRLIA